MPLFLKGMKNSPETECDPGSIIESVLKQSQLNIYSPSNLQLFYAFLIVYNERPTRALHHLLTTVKIAEHAY